MNNEIEEFAEKNNIPLNKILMEGRKDVQENNIHPYGVYSVIYDGEYITYKPGMRKETIEKLSEKIKVD